MLIGILMFLFFGFAGGILLWQGYLGLTKGIMTIIGVRGYLREVSDKEAKFFGTIYIVLGVIILLPTIVLFFTSIL